MSTAKKLEEEIVSYLTRLNENQKKAVLTVVKTFAEEEEYDHWSDPLFVQEMDARYQDMKTGKDKGLSWEQLKESARNNYEKKKRK